MTHLWFFLWSIDRGDKHMVTSVPNHAARRLCNQGRSASETLYVINPKGLYVIKPPKEHTALARWLHTACADYIQRASALITYQATCRRLGSKKPRLREVFSWRTGWDSNPRALARKLISSQPRYDHFDTCPYSVRRGRNTGTSATNLIIPQTSFVCKSFFLFFVKSIAKSK